jgi:hypothetical protein
VEQEIKNGVTSVADTPPPSQEHRVVTPESIAAVEALVMENHRMSIDEIAETLNMSHGSAHHVIHDVFQFHEVSAKQVPWQLTPQLKHCVDACEELLWCLEAGDGLLSRIVTGNEIWVHYHQPETENEQGMASFLIIKTQEVLQRRLC